MLKNRIIDNEKFGTADKVLLENETKAITSYIRMNYKPFEELSSLLSINHPKDDDYTVPKELLEFFFKRCDILEIDKNNFNKNKNYGKQKNLQILNRKSGNQNC